MKSYTRSAFLLAFLASSAAAQIPAYTFHGTAGDQMGVSVHSASDADGDGFDDVIVGSPFDDPNGANSGSARVYSGKTGALLHTFKGEHPGDQFGTAVTGVMIASVGHAYLVVGAPLNNNFASNGGSIYIYDGASGVLLQSFGGTMAGGLLGASVAGIGDVDHDGVADIAMGAPFASYGGATSNGMLFFVSGRTLLSMPSFMFGAASSDEFGYSVENAGDIDKDGVQDIVVGAPFGGSGNHGAAYVISMQTLNTIYSKFGTSANAQFGYSVSGDRDVDNDGYPDFIAGAPYESSVGIDNGEAKVFSGKTGSLIDTVKGSSGAKLGYSVSLISDVDGDGFADYLVGAPYADYQSLANAGAANLISGQTGTEIIKFGGDAAGDHCGLSVCRAGDCNNDGTPDLIIGSPLNNDGGANAGLARVWFMGANPPSVYCTAKINSNGCTPSIGFSGEPLRVTGPDDFTISATHVLINKNGLLFWSMTKTGTPFEGGTLCVKSPAIRTPVQNSGCATCGACQGSYSYLFSQSYMAAHALHAGDTLYAQYWSRDPGFAAPANVGLTDALKFTLVK